MRSRARRALVLTALSVLPAAALVACSSQAASPTGTIAGRAVAGPVCPVETTPPDPACAPMPVAGAVVVVAMPGGGEVARTTTGDDGAFSVAVEAGTYAVSGEPVEGLMGAPKSPVTVQVEDAATTDEVLLEYDTGIR